MTNRTLTGLLALVTVGASACGSNEPRISSDDDEEIPAGGAGGMETTSTTGAGGVGGEAVVPTFEEAHAPTQYSVVITVSEADFAEASWLSPQSYELVGELGDALTVEAVELDQAAGTVTLATGKQKLGVSYTLTLAGELPLAGASATFPSADTARFWSSDFSSPNFSQIEIQTKRLEVGTHGVLYLQEGLSLAGASAHMADFDENIFPVETALFTEPPDIDGNEKTIVVALDGQQHFAGYFNPVDSLTEAEAQMWGIHSNEAEIVYMNAVQGDFQAGTLAHEFQHLLFNREHGFEGAQWRYHNEGLSECAEHLVYGTNPSALPILEADPFGAIADGVSLVHFETGYDNYVIAYMFWTYVAAQLDGIPTWGQLFQQDGDPAAMSSYLQAELGRSMNEVIRDMWIAMHVQDEAGVYSFGSMLDFQGVTPPIAPTATLSLEPFGAAFVPPPAASVAYPGGQGSDMIYVGINGAGAIDLSAPFDTSGGGRLLAVNMSDDAGETPVQQPVGLDLVGPQAPVTSLVRDPAWHHPPPLYPQDDFAAVRAWREQTRLR